VVLQRRLVDLLGELRLVLRIGLHRIEVLGPIDEARIENALAAFIARIRIVPDFAASRNQRREKAEKDQNDAHGPV
jgi:hypothetical protein